MRKLTIVLLCAACVSMAAIHDPVRVDSGQLSGGAGSSPDVRVYKGIPFAAPPVGDLRWKAPKAPAAWDGVKQATQFSPVCMQTPNPKTSIYYRDPEPTSEDCLYLNVWTSAKSAKEKRPVMVWIHGGALTKGAASIPTYDGEVLAKKGVVLVSVNYRLGIFGFFAHPELTKESDRNSSGNYGLLDQIAALEWVQKNIAAFGGDPKRVTIFGESAGSWSVNYLMASPLAKGLFQRVIGESGAVFGVMRKREEMEASGVKFATTMGGNSIKSLRAKSAADVMKASATTNFGPNVDGWFLPQDVYTIFANAKQNDVPILIGSNADEGKSLTQWPANGTAATFIDQSKRRYADKSADYLKIYPAGSNEQAKESFYASFRDQIFGWQMRTWARMENRSGRSKVFLYYFDRVPPGPTSAQYGAYHASEIAYVFGNFEPPRPWEPADHQLSDAMSSYWVNFATKGDPNGKGLPNWPVYKESSDIALGLGDTIRQIPSLNKAALDFLDGYYASQHAAAR